jgi:hemolysin activation/secretion protein
LPVETKTGLGGWPTLRGFNSNRFVGKLAAYGSMELRWTFAETEFLGQYLQFAVAPFVDVGRVFDGVDQLSSGDWKVSAGGGLRLAWNLATLINLDVGVSEENTLFYLEVGRQF